MNKKVLIALFAVAAVLRLAMVWQPQLWYDENFTLILSRLPLDRMLAAVAGDTHPPLYYLLIWPLGQLLKSPNAPVWVLRLPSVIFSLAALWVFWCILKNFELKPRVRAVALILMAIMPIQLYYAQEARMYALLEFLVLAGFLAMLKRRWVWFGITGVLMLYTQYYGGFYWAALALIALIRNWNDRASCKKAMRTAGLAGLAFLPWVIILAGQMGNIQGSYWMQMDSAGAPLLTLLDTLFFSLSTSAVIQTPVLLAGFAWLFMALIVIFFGKMKPPIYRFTICIMAFLPIILATITSLVWQPILYYRPLIGSTPFLYLIMAAPVEMMFDASGHLLRRRTLYALCIILPAVLICDISIYAYSGVTKSSGGEQIELAYIQQHWQPGDVALGVSDQDYVNMLPYAPDLPLYLIPQCSNERGRLSDATRQAIGIQSASPDLTYHRAWILWTYSPLTLVGEDCATDLFHLGDPVLLNNDDEFVYSGLWLVEKPK
jgi:uncharacterized membrane protein